MMTAFNLTEDQVITAITVGVDFSVSQVVNGNWGMQTIIPKVEPALYNPWRASPNICASHCALPLVGRVWSERACVSQRSMLFRAIHA